MASLTSYKGLQIVTPPPTGAGGAAIQDDFISLVDWHPKSIWDATADPDVTDDTGLDFQPGSLWLRIDTDPMKLFLCQDSTAMAAVWQELVLKLATPVATKTADYTIQANDSVILADASGGAFNVTLPTAVGIAGREYRIKRTNNAGGNVTVNTTSSQTIDGSTTFVLSTQYESLSVVSNGSQWMIF